MTTPTLQQRLATHAAAINPREPMGRQRGDLQALANAFKGEGLCSAIRIAATNGDNDRTKVQAAPHLKMGKPPEGVDVVAVITENLQTVVKGYRKLKLVADVTLPNGTATQVMVEY